MKVAYGLDRHIDGFLNSSSEYDRLDESGIIKNKCNSILKNSNLLLRKYKKDGNVTFEALSSNIIEAAKKLLTHFQSNRYISAPSVIRDDYDALINAIDIFREQDWLHLSRNHNPDRLPEIWIVGRGHAASMARLIN